MNKRERIEQVFRLEAADRIPFVPAIYEHKAALIGSSPSRVCRDPEALHRALRRELEVYDPDMLVVGVDVYNVEAEAMGCRVTFFEEAHECPAIAEPVLDEPAEAMRLSIPDPETDGRMPLFLQVAGDLHAEIGAQVIVRGAVTGPFSLAAQLAGTEALLIASAENSAWVDDLLRICAHSSLAFGRAFLRRGVEPILFDSRATPQIASPRLFRQLILPIYRDFLFPELRAAGARLCTLVIGGDTTLILDDLILSGAGQIICDPPSQLDCFLQKCRRASLPLRASVDARLVHRGPPEAIRESAREILRHCGDQPGLLLGCGVVAFGTPREHVLAIRSAIDEAAARKNGGSRRPPASD